MSLQNFRTYNLAIQFHQSCTRIKVSDYLQNQLLRASSSVVLNLAEGSAKPTEKDRRRYYHIAFGSLRECQAALELSACSEKELILLADHLAACLYKLCRPKPT